MEHKKRDIAREAEEKNEFYKAILLLENTEECADFFEDICTINELKLISQRLQVAKLLKNGATFNEIVTLTGASTATISRVNRSFLHGSGAYAQILEKMEEQG